MQGGTFSQVTAQILKHSTETTMKAGSAIDH